MRTIAAGVGGGLGLLLGALLILAGVLRLYLSTREWLESSPVSSGSSRRPRWPRSPTARSPRRSSSRSASSRSTRSASRRGCCSRSARCSSSSRSRTRREPPRSPRPAAPRPSSGARSTTSSGFLTGWAIFLDYVIVIALAALFVPHYLGNAVGWDALTTSPTDLFVGIGVICVDGRGALRPPAEPVPARDRRSPGSRSSALLLLIVLGMPLLFSVDNLEQGHRPRDGADVVRDRVRDPRRDARLHGAGDGREPGRRDARARAHAAAEPLRRHRRRGRRLVPDRPGRALRVSRRSGDPARHPLAARAARRASPTRSRGTCPAGVVDVTARLHRADRRRDPRSP